MVLLDILRKKPGLELVIAHFNHGIRGDAIKDETLVVKTATKYSLKHEIGHGMLGSGTSEAKARHARYDFLISTRKKYNAKVIITAHHQDDLIETALISVFRGTGRSGLVSMIHNKEVLRPLINIPKRSLIKYAENNNIVWSEDSTNDDDIYLRNYIRRHILNNAIDSDKVKLLREIDKVAIIGNKIDNIIATISQNVIKEGLVSRDTFIKLPSEIADELMIYWLKKLGLNSFNRKTVARLSNAIKTGLHGTKHEVFQGYKLEIGQFTAQFSNGVSSRLL